MFISQLSLDSMNRTVMRLLVDIYKLHQVVMAGFADYSEVNRVLFRVEPEIQNRTVHILLQGPVAPSKNLFADKIEGLVSVRTKEFAPVFKVGRNFRFRLRANPTVTRNGKRYGLINDESLEQWLRGKEDQVGVRFTSMTAIDEGYLSGIQKKRDISHRVNIKVTRYEGFLQIVDSDRFSLALAKGIGPAKAFGCGLLSLARR